MNNNIDNNNNNNNNNNNMRQVKTATVSVIVGALDIVKKRPDKPINKTLRRPSLHEIQKLRFVELLISLGEYYQCDRKIFQRVSEKYYLKEAA